MSQRNKRDRNKASKLNCDCEQCPVDLLDYCTDYIECNLYSTSPYRLRNFHSFIDLILFIFGALYVVFVPYTKHEESFNMQATHDLLFNGYLDWNSHEYLHSDPRMVTFAAAKLISMMIFPFKFIALFIPSIHLQQQCQYLIRFALLFLNIVALSKFRQSFVLSYFVQETDIYILNRTNKYKKSVRAHAHMSHIKIAMIQRFSLLFTVLIIAQFHFLFYSSRLLPNCLALPSITIAFAHLFRNNVKRTSLWLVIACVLYPHNCIILVPFILFFVRCKQRKQTQTPWLILLWWSCVHCALVLLTIACIISMDSWLWNRFISFDEVSLFSWPTLDSLRSGFSLIPNMLLINTFFIILSVFKIHPMLFLNALTNRYKDEPRSTRELIALFIDWQSVCLLFICALFIICSHGDTNRLLVVCPPLTLLSTMGCIRLCTLWGFKGFENANYTIEWFMSNLYERQKELYFLWIPHHLLFSSVVKKLVSLEPPLTFINLRRYLKVVFKDIPREIMRKQTGFIALSVSLSILISICFAFHQVYEASYDYPGGVAITLFPNIIDDYKTNMIWYHDEDMQEEDESMYYREPEEEEHNDTLRSRHGERENRAIHSTRGHKMNRDYTTNMNASIGDPYHSAHVWHGYDAIDCVHIGKLAAVSGVTRFLTPSFYEEYRFDTRYEIEMEEYALLKDPCNLYEEMYSKICDDEEYFERHDDYLHTNEDCESSMDYNQPMIHGFDYLISEYSSVPGYYLIPHGIIYARPMHSSFKSQMVSLMRHMFSFFSNTENRFLEPSLYVLKRQTNEP
eukprot:170736_1